MSDTPRTDELVVWIPSGNDAPAEDVVPADFARVLERELNSALRTLNGLYHPPKCGWER